MNCTPLSPITIIKQLLDEVEHDITNYQNRGLCSAEADNTVAVKRDDSKGPH